MSREEHLRDCLKEHVREVRDAQADLDLAKWDLINAALGLARAQQAQEAAEKRFAAASQRMRELAMKGASA